MPELIVIFVVALVLFGPKRLPELGAALGKGIRDFKKALNEDEKPPPPQELPPSPGLHAEHKTPVNESDASKLPK